MRLLVALSCLLGAGVSAYSIQQEQLVSCLHLPLQCWRGKYELVVLLQDAARFALQAEPSDPFLLQETAGEPLDLHLQQPADHLQQ